jgi:hypothetical protein
MTDILCGYANRDDTIVAYLYDDIDPAERRVFQSHLLTCTTCRDEVAAFKSVRQHLARWDPPHPASIASPQVHPQSASRSLQWLRQVPVWAQVAAALLFLGVSAGIANLDVRHDQKGWTVRTGWSRGSGSSGGSDVAQGFIPVGDAPWRADLMRLEQQLKSEIRSTPASAGNVSNAAPMARTVSAGDADTLKRVRALLDESEKRQQRELALRVAELLRDVNAQRQADLIKIDRNLGQMESSLGTQVIQNRQQMNYLMRVNQRQ